MFTARRLVPAAACVAAVLFPVTAHAFENVEIGVGVVGQAGANFLDKPGDQTLDVNGQALAVDPEYPGFAGFSGGMGGMIDVRFMKYVGLEFDVIHQWDFGSAELKITDLTSGNSTKFDVEIGNTALHMPLLLKGVLPGEVVQPMLFVGPEFVVPIGDATAETQNVAGSVPISTTYRAASGNYVNVMFGLGMEFVLPIESDVVSVRIPLTLRGSINPGVSDKRVERANYTLSGGELDIVEYKTDWKFQAAANLGVSAHF